MTYYRRFQSAVALCALLMAASCTSSDPKLYTIAPLPGSPLSDGPKVVALHGVGIARYLQRSQIVESSEEYRIALRPGDWWGEPLDTMMNRILVQELNQRLPGATVYGDNGAEANQGENMIRRKLIARACSFLILSCAGLHVAAFEVAPKQP